MSVNARNSNADKKVCCIVVTFNPDVSKLISLVQSVKNNGAELVVVDNGSNNQKTLKLMLSSAVLILNKFNLGIAQAQNQGIAEAIRGGAEFVWLADQDTEFPTYFVERMLGTFRVLTAAGHRIGAIGPLYSDAITARDQPFFRAHESLAPFVPSAGVHEVGMLISSGMFIPRTAILQVGVMNERYFIDFVDFEWCWRARREGLTLFGVSEIRIAHRLGDAKVVFAGRTVTVRSPDRVFYIVRNATYILLFLRTITLKTRLRLLWGAYVTAAVLAARLHTKRQNYLYALIEGLLRGAIGSMGPR